MKKIIFLIYALTCLILISCSSGKLVTPETEGEQLQILYKNAIKKAKNNDYLDAAVLFEDIERQYPYSSWASQSQLMAAYCYLKSNLNDESIHALDRYLMLNPGSRDIDYAYYLKGLNQFNQISDVQRDQSATKIAKKSFIELKNRFPESKYIEDVEKKLIFINDKLAGQELLIGRNYQEDFKWISAINRYNYILKNYPKTKYVPETLHRLVEDYYAMGLLIESKKYAATLGYNYPETYWYKASYKLINEKLVKTQ